MLKRLPDWGGEWARWFRQLHDPATGRPGFHANRVASGTAGPGIKSATLRVGWISEA